MAYSQNLSFTDVKFKALLLSSNSTNQIAQDFNGNSIAIDNNGDGEIQLSEALRVKVLHIKIDSNQMYIDPAGNTSDPGNIKTVYYNNHLPDGISDALLFSNLEELYFWNTKTAHISFTNNTKIKKVQGRPFYYDLSQGGQYIASPINLSFNNCSGVEDIADIIAYQTTGNPWHSPENNLTIKNCLQINSNGLINSAELKELYIQNSNINTLTFNSCHFLEKIIVPNLNTLTKISILGNYSTSLSTSLPNQDIELIANNCMNLQEIIADTDHYYSTGAYFSKVNLNGCISLKKILGLNTQIIDFSTAGLINLEELDCSFYNRSGYYTNSGIYFGNVNSLNLVGLPKLKILKAFNQKISNNVNFSAAQALENINITNTCGYMPTVNVSNLSNLHTLKTDRSLINNTQGEANLQNIIAKNCPMLSSFTFNNNGDLRKLDLENCPGLRVLAIDYNLADGACPNLEEINIKQCTGFKEITVNGTKIPALNTKDCTALQSLNLSDNTQLTSVNISSNPNLESLSLSTLPLITQIDTSNTPHLKNVFLNNCSQINELNFSTLSHLQAITLWNMSNLTSVNLRNGSIEEFIDLNNNNSSLSVCVDDAQLSDVQAMYPDTTFTTNCGAALRSTPSKTNINQIHFFPNPVKDILQINADIPIKNVKLMDAQQRIIFDQNFNKTMIKIDLSNYPSAVYIMKIITKKNQMVEKIIKK